MNHNSYIPQNNQMVNTIEHLDAPRPGFFKRNLGLVKQLLIYTILFIIFSHCKMTELLCNRISILDTTDSNIPCIAFKGLLMGIVIIILRKLTNL